MVTIIQLLIDSQVDAVQAREEAVEVVEADRALGLGARRREHGGGRRQKDDEAVLHFDGGLKGLCLKRDGWLANCDLLKRMYLAVTYLST